MRFFLYITIGMVCFSSLFLRLPIYAEEGLQTKASASPSSLLFSDDTVSPSMQTDHISSPSSEIYTSYGTVTGIVMDRHTKQPIAGALVTVEFGSLETTTDADGRYSLRIGLDDVYRVIQLQISHSLYARTRVENILIFPDTEESIDVSLGSEEEVVSRVLPRALTQQERDISVQPTPRGGQRVSAGSIDTVPATINVAITDYINCYDWLDAGQPVVRVDTMDFKEYVKNVLPNEWIASWEMEALKAGAIAAKNYGWRKINVGARHYLKDKHNLSKYPDVVDNTCDQVYLPNSSRDRTNVAVDVIWGYRLIRDGNLLSNFYLATQNQCSNSPYQPCLPQWETQYRAQEGKNWQQIIHQYYDPVEISQASVGQAVPTSVPVQTVVNAIYRFWSDANQGHFYTGNVEERDFVINNYNDFVWRYEGIAYIASFSAEQGMVPVYRFWSDAHQGHFYTANAQEKNIVISKYDDFIWRYEGVGYYVYPNFIIGTRPVYRFWSDLLQKHFYTASDAERDYILTYFDTRTWRYEGTAWYVTQ